MVGQAPLTAIVKTGDYLILQYVVQRLGFHLVLVGRVVELFTGGKISVGPPYFDIAFAIPMLPLVFLIGMVQSLGRYDDLALSQILERLPFVLPSALSYSMPLALLIGIYQGGSYAGAMSATAIGIPGTPAAAVCAATTS